MRLTRLKLENFKACRSVDLALAPLTVLIGANNAGKSSILHSIALPAQSVMSIQPISAGTLVDLGDRADALIHRADNATRAESARIGLHWAGPGDALPVVDLDLQMPARGGALSELRAGFPLDSGREASIYASGSELIITVPGLAPQQARTHQPSLWSFALQGWASPQPPRAAVAAFQRGQPYLQQFAAEALLRFRYIGANRHIENSVFPLGREPVSNPRTAQELVDTLAYDDHLLELVSDRCRSIFGYGVDKDLIPGQRITIVAKGPGGTRNVVNLGTGFIQTVWLLTQLELAVAQPPAEHWPLAPIVGIEEPELHIHPGKQPDIARLLGAFVEAGLSIICTTQSEHLLLALLSLVLEGRLSADQVVVYYLQEGRAEQLAVDEQGRIEGGLRGFFEANEEQLRRHIELLKQRG